MPQPKGAAAGKVKHIAIRKELGPSPDSSANPFVPVFGTKDWNGQREKGPEIK